MNSTAKSRQTIPIQRREFNIVKAGVSPQLFQVKPQWRHQHANASGGKLGFELATDGIQFYFLAN